MDKLTILQTQSNKKTDQAFKLQFAELTARAMYQSEMILAMQTYIQDLERELSEKNAIIESLEQSKSVES